MKLVCKVCKRESPRLKYIPTLQIDLCERCIKWLLQDLEITSALNGTWIENNKPSKVEIA